MGNYRGLKRIKFKPMQAADLCKAQPVKINLNKKLDSKQKTSQIFNIDAQGFGKTKNENPPTQEIRVTS